MARSRRKKLLLGLAVALGALVALELIARVAYRGRWPHFFVHDPELGWAHRAGWSGQVRAGVEASFDELGLREERPRATDGRPRVLLLGDSVAFGYGLAQEATIARALERASTTPLEVLNAGVPGYATEQETRLLARLAPILRPKAAVLLFCLRNDLGVPPLDPSAANDLVPRDRFARALLDRSALAFAIARALHRESVRSSREDGGEPPFLTPGAIAALSSAERAATFEVARERLREYREVARAHGVTPLLVLCPETTLLSGEVPRAAVIDPLIAIGRELELPTLDLFGALAGPQHLREKDGVHPTPAGAERVAAAILPHLPLE